MSQEDRLELRLHELRLQAGALADAAATRFQMENSRKSVLAMAMKTAEQHGHKSVASQEREAYASAEYQTWLNGAVEAVRNHERLRLEFDLIRYRFEAWRTLQATKRAEMQLQ